MKEIITTGEALEILHKMAEQSSDVRGDRQQQALDMIEDLIVNYYAEEDSDGGSSCEPAGSSIEAAGKKLAEAINARNSNIKHMLSLWSNKTKQLPDMGFLIVDTEDQGELFLVTGRIDLCTVDQEIGFHVCDDWFFERYQGEQSLIHEVLRTIYNVLPLVESRINEVYSSVTADGELINKITELLQETE